MKPTSLQILVTSQPAYEGVDCFIWGSSKSGKVFTLEQLERLLKQIDSLGSIRQIVFEGGETLVFYQALVALVSRAAAAGLSVGVISSGFWATSIAEGRAWLRPLMAAGLTKLELTDSLVRGTEEEIEEEHPGFQAARRLKLNASLVRLEQAADQEAAESDLDQIPLSIEVTYQWDSFIDCPKDKILNPERMLIDPAGQVHVCRGLVIGNIWEQTLEEILSAYNPASHPIAGPLLEGGPAALARRYGLAHRDSYESACKLCRDVRAALRPRFPTMLVPVRRLGLT